MERRPSLRQVIRAEVGGVYHAAGKLIHDASLMAEALRAPDGELVRNEEIVAKGRMVWKGSAILTEKGELIVSNHLAGDAIRKVPRK